ncbi:amidohydrolase family protein [Marinibactrum halimedae]|uniref:Bifunctional TolB-family protein/amidohydrolase n=1 Tax=Marinibactrum halimedae TaxID=1444977 RepID=A0AA37T4F9_9GAMM|nr:amidohydrolase family protein [Marinibactrum halimedae]MCD9458497.1 amidohydrolase family protein [Marinibactrum halimedae]GLS26640.1 bifunctional TolB-family protein/amidohydrolase [Marinibactrum halimedae]
MRNRIAHALCGALLSFPLLTASSVSVLAATTETSLTTKAGRPNAQEKNINEESVNEESVNEEKNKAWDVSAPPGQWRDITIDTQTTTWSFIDVSPDGKTLIFDMLGDIYSLPIAGGEATALTQGIEWNFQPTFSPDGKKIAFISDRDGYDNIWVINADGSEPVQITKETRHNIHNPAWSPDSQWIAARKGTVYSRSIPSGEIWMYHINGGAGVELVNHPDGKKAQKSMGEPAYSPDGKYVYYSKDTTPGWVWQYNKDSTGEIFSIKRLELATGKTDTLTGGPGGAVRPTPSPDGKKVAFVKRLSDFNSAIYIKDLASGNEEAVFNKLERDNQETAGSHGNTTSFEWMPNNRDLVFWTAGKIHRLNTETKAISEIPLHVKTTKQVRKTLRYTVDVAPDEFKTKMLRWAQETPDGKTAIFQTLGHLYQSTIENTSSASNSQPQQSSKKQKRLTKQNDHFEFWPALSRDGKRVVYTTWDDQALGTVRTVSSKGGRGKVLVSAPGHYVEPQFSPDGKWVVYRKITGGYLLSPQWSAEPGIYVVSAKGGTPKKITHTGTHPQFSHDGKRILFSSRGDSGLELKSVDLNGFDERVLAKGEKVTSYTVSPDGQWLAFTEHFNAFVMPFTPAGKPLSVSRNTKSVPVKQVSQRAGEFLHWSADSQSLNWSNGPLLYNRPLKDAFVFFEQNGAKEDSEEANIRTVDLGFTVKADKPNSTLALVGANIVTMKNADTQQEIIKNGVVIVEGNRIVSVTTKDNAKVPENAEVIDVTGKTIIPGLVDAHAHGGAGMEEITPEQNWMQYSNLSFGVTTIHDPSNDTSEIFAHAELQKAGKVIGPRTFSTGTILYGANAPGYTSEVNSLEDAEFHIERLKAAGAISVKSYNQLGRRSRQQIIEAAEKHQIMVMPEGGMKLQHNLNQLVDGHTSIEHALPIAHIYDDIKQLWEQVDTGYTPTFGVAYGGISGENYWYDRTDVWMNERLMRYSPKQFVEPRSMRRTHAPDHHYNHFNVATTAKQLRDKGVRVLIGAHGQREGLAAHWEMWMMEQGGFTPWEAIRGATIDGAIHLGMDNDIGSIEPGKLADLVIIDGDPLTDIRQSEMISHTMINGRLYDVSTMNEVASGNYQRQAFFFEKDGGNQLPTATAKAMEAKMQRHHWRH